MSRSSAKSPLESASKGSGPKPVVIRLSAENADRVKTVLKDLGEEGQRGLKRIEEAGRPASRGLQLVNAALFEAARSLDQPAARLVPLCGIARALGPRGGQLVNAALYEYEIGAADRIARAVEFSELARDAHITSPELFVPEQINVIDKARNETRNIVRELADTRRDLSALLKSSQFNPANEARRTAAGNSSGQGVQFSEPVREKPGPKNRATSFDREDEKFVRLARAWKRRKIVSTLAEAARRCCEKYSDKIWTKGGWLSECVPGTRPSIEKRLSRAFKKDWAIRGLLQ